jgi:hypothetical protein
VNAHLRKQVDQLLSKFQRVILVSCGPAGPHASHVVSELHDGCLILQIQRTSDHLFNLELQPDLTVLTPEWELVGTGQILPTNAAVFLHSWQARIKVIPVRLHVLDPDNLRRVETIDF